MSIMQDPTMDIPMETLQLIVDGISDDGKISAEAEKALRAIIAEGKSRDYINPMGETKRQVRKNLDAAPGKKVGEAIDKLW